LADVANESPKGMRELKWTTTYCFYVDLEGLSPNPSVNGSGLGTDYGSVQKNVVAIATFDATVLSGYLNSGTSMLFSGNLSGENAGKRIHLFGGGDYSQPDTGTFRGGIISNYAWNNVDAQAFFTSEKAFYSALSFP
jgi:hypothetical protein